MLQKFEPSFGQDPFDRQVTILYDRWAPTAQGAPPEPQQSTPSMSKLKTIRTYGFTLVEMAVVLAIFGLLAIFLMPTVVVAVSQKNRSETTQKLKNIESAIYSFMILNRRLPCPANGLLSTGTEARDVSGDCTSNQINGVVPWVTLGLAYSDVVDNWNNQVTFRIGYSLARTAALDMSSCDPAGTAATNPATAGAPSVNLGLCAATCTGTFAAANCTSPQNFLLRKGLDVSNGTTRIADYTAYTSAAFVLISHGDNGYGAITNGRVYQPAAQRAIAGTTLEAPNINQSSLVVTSATPPQFVAADLSDDAVAATYFDDIVVRPQLMAVIAATQLGPRSH